MLHEDGISEASSNAAAHKSDQALPTQEAAELQHLLHEDGISEASSNAAAHKSDQVLRTQAAVKLYYGLSILDIHVRINVKAENMQVSLVGQATLDNPVGVEHYWVRPVDQAVVYKWFCNNTTANHGNAKLLKRFDHYCIALGRIAAYHIKHLSA